MMPGRRVFENPARTKGRFAPNATCYRKRKTASQNKRQNNCHDERFIDGAGRKERDNARMLRLARVVMNPLVKLG
jgi:hypothetical protein